jgi:hypothetical protein
MPQKIDLQEILKKNPNVDPERLSAGLKLSEELRQARSGSKRARPLIRRRVRIVDDLRSDPRLTQLSSLRKKAT